MARFTGKVAFLTGAGAGIARAASRMFAAEGAKVVVIDKDADLAAAAANEIVKTGGDAISIAIDATQDAAVKSAVDKAMQKYSRIDVLVNCVGGSLKTDKPIADADLSFWKPTMDLNLYAAYLGCHFVIPIMMKQRSGSIVNLSSWSATRGSHPKHFYSAAKGGIISLTRSIAGEYTKYGIRANSIAPGSVMTERWVANHLVENSTDTFESRRKEFAESYPFSTGEPKDIASIILFLASDESRMITGALIPADGGRSAF